jgi:hypothetical protein
MANGQHNPQQVNFSNYIDKNNIKSPNISKIVKLKIFNCATSTTQEWLHK